MSTMSRGRPGSNALVRGDWRASEHAPRELPARIPDQSLGWHDGTALFGERRGR